MKTITSDYIDKQLSKHLENNRLSKEAEEILLNELSKLDNDDIETTNNVTEINLSYKDVVKPLSLKALNSIRYTGFLNAWEGSVRSSKTVVSLIAFLMYVVQCKDNVFIMSGKTISSLDRNCITGNFGILKLVDKGCISYKKDNNGNNVIEVIGLDNQVKKIYCFGANNERSFMSLRGLTAAGWYADEVNLHPKSFIEEAFRRTIVSTNRKHFWTLNPDNPYHFIYTDYLDKYLKDEVKGFYLWHFTLDDNKAITEERKEELKRQFSGIFYKRYIEGLRVSGEGVVYDCVNESNFYNEITKPQVLKNPLRLERYIGIDYGTTNPCVFLDIYDDGDTLYIDNEYYFDGRNEVKKTDSLYRLDLVSFIKSNMDVRVNAIILDPSAESFNVELVQHGLYVLDADNSVLDGIRITHNLLQQRKIKVNKDKCMNTIKELYSYSWDTKAAESGREQPLKTNDHCMDALRYVCKTVIPEFRISNGK